MTIFQRNERPYVVAALRRRVPEQIIIHSYRPSTWISVCHSHPDGAMRAYVPGNPLGAVADIALTKPCRMPDKPRLRPKEMEPSMKAQVPPLNLENDKPARKVPKLSLDVAHNWRKRALKLLDERKKRDEAEKT